MKNIQIVDGAQHCVFSIFQAHDDEFAILFPGRGQDVQFAEDIVNLKDPDAAAEALKRLWTRPIRKRDAHGIHGTIFYKLEQYRKVYPTKREDEVDPSAISPLSVRFSPARLPPSPNALRPWADAYAGRPWLAAADAAHGAAPAGRIARRE